MGTLTEQQEVLDYLSKKSQEAFITIIIDRENSLLAFLLLYADAHGYEVIMPRAHLTAREKAIFVANRRGWPQKENLGAVAPTPWGFYLVKKVKSEVMTAPKVKNGKISIRWRSNQNHGMIYPLPARQER